jgi:hypothetical protein
MKDMKKHIEEWKFSSGALVMCLVAYPEGLNARSFQYVFILIVFSSCFSPDSQCGELIYGWKYLHKFLQGLEDWNLGKLQQVVG